MRTCPQCSTAADQRHRFCHACGHLLPQSAAGDPLVGTTLPGGYVLRELIAEGGMGRVYRAEQPALGREVAVKLIHAHLANDPVVAPRFLIEARSASRINHPNAVTIYAFGNAPGGVPYLVMQLLKGKPLTRLAAESPGGLRPWRIVDILCQVLAALEQAHAVSIVHGDVKPDNIIVERLHSGEELVKVIDFGLARLVTDTADLMSSHVVGGTPAYMSPEHARGDVVDPRNDLYSVGVILYELLTGALPFDAPSTTETLLAILHQKPIDPRERAPDREIPAALAELAMRALEKSAEQRFQSAGELMSALAATLEPPSARERAAPEAAVESTGPTCRACGTRSPSRRAFCGECGAPMGPERETLPDF
ncbi:MAG: protein kinase [Labilithrix sp.]|nr:protein kinase [Labilithrix sp.]